MFFSSADMCMVLPSLSIFKTSMIVSATEYVVFLPDGQTHQLARPVALPLGWSWTGTRNPCGHWTICTRRVRGKTVNPPRCSVLHPLRSYTLLQWEEFVVLKKRKFKLLLWQKKISFKKKQTLGYITPKKLFKKPRKIVSLALPHH